MTTLHAISELICTSTMLGLIKLWRSRIREETVDWVWIAENSWWSVLPLSQRSRYVTVSWQLTFRATSFGAGLAGFYEYWSQPEWWFICCRPFRTIFICLLCACLQRQWHRSTVKSMNKSNLIWICWMGIILETYIAPSEYYMQSEYSNKMSI